MSRQAAKLADDRELTAKLFRGFADLSRLSILESLRNGSLTVGDIVLATGLTQPNASNHLRCLSECGLVASKQDGRFVRYRLTDRRIAQLLELADEVSADNAGGVGNCEQYK